MSVELLRDYKRQNPRKYALKYGDRTPEEAAELLKPSSPFMTGAVKVEIVGTKDIEVDFKEPEVPVNLPVVAEEAPKKRKVK